MAVRINVDGTRIEMHPTHGAAFHLSELHIVVGGYIEAVHLKDGRVMWVNEEGKLRALPVNEAATVIAHASGHDPTDMIVGDVIITTVDEAGGRS